MFCETNIKELEKWFLFGFDDIIVENTGAAS